MSNFTRRIAAATIATLSLAAIAPAASAEASPPDVRTIGFETYCGTSATVYELHLENVGDRRRTVRASMALRHEGWSVTFTRTIPSGRTVVERFRLGSGEQAVLTLRSQKQVIGRVRMYGTCRRVA